MKDNRSNIFNLSMHRNGFMFVYKNNNSMYASLYLRQPRILPNYYVLSMGVYLRRNRFEQEHTKFFTI